jgi:ATP-binding cassette, subfamily C, bacterial
LMIKGYVTEYPGRVALSAASYVLVGMTEIVGVAALLPLLSILGGDGGAPSSKIGIWFFDLYKAAGIEPTIGSILVTIFVLILLKSILTICAVSQVMYAASYIGADTRQKMIQAHTQAKWSLFQNLPAGRLASVISTEAQHVSVGYSALAKLFADFIRAGIHLVFAAYLAWEVTAAAIGVGLVAVLVLSRLMTITRLEGGKLTNSTASFSARLVDGLGGMKPLKAMGKEVHLAALLAWEVTGIQQAHRKLGILSQSTFAIQEPIMVAALAMGLYFMWEDWQGQMEVLLVIALVFLRSVQTIFQQQKNYQVLLQKEAPYWLVQKLLNEARSSVESSSGEKIPSFAKTLQFSNVNFSYGSNQILKQASFEISVGSFTAISGPSGVGKTTVVDLVIGIRTPDGGNVLVDGVPLEEFSSQAWRQLIGYVPQESFLFHETILTNVTLGDPNVTKEDAVAALKLSEAWEFVSELPEDIETVVGEHGSRFSGGQRQRIAIARALVHKPKLLVLDEATSALDPGTEAAICQTLETLKGKITILAISHGTEINRVADKVLGLKDGKLIEMPLQDN